MNLRDFSLLAILFVGLLILVFIPEPCPCKVISSPNSKGADPFFEKGRLLYKKGHKKEAIEYLEKALSSRPSWPLFIKILTLFSNGPNESYKSRPLRHYRIAFSTNSLVIALPEDWTIQVSSKNHCHIFKRGNKNIQKIVLFYDSLSCPSKICIEKVFENSCRNFEKKFRIMKKGWEGIGSKRLLSATLTPKKARRSNLYIKFFTVADRDFTHNILFVSRKSRVSKAALALLEDILLRVSGQVKKEGLSERDIDISPLEIQVIKDQVDEILFK